MSSLNAQTRGAERKGNIRLKALFWRSEAEVLPRPLKDGELPRSGEETVSNLESMTGGGWQIFMLALGRSSATLLSVTLYRRFGIFFFVLFCYFYLEAGPVKVIIWKSPHVCRGRLPPIPNPQPQTRQIASSNREKGTDSLFATVLRVPASRSR